MWETAAEGAQVLRLCLQQVPGKAHLGHCGAEAQVSQQPGPRCRTCTEQGLTSGQKSGAGRTGMAEWSRRWTSEKWAERRKCRMFGSEAVWGGTILIRRFHCWVLAACSRSPCADTIHRASIFPSYPGNRRPAHGSPGRSKLCSSSWPSVHSQQTAEPMNVHATA